MVRIKALNSCHECVQDKLTNSFNSFEAEWRIYVGKLTIIGSDNGLSPGRRQAIIWTNAGIFLNPTLWTNFSETLIEIHTFSLKKINAFEKVCEMAAILSRPQSMFRQTNDSQMITKWDKIYLFTNIQQNRNYNKESTTYLVPKMFNINPSRIAVRQKIFAENLMSVNTKTEPLWIRIWKNTWYIYVLSLNGTGNIKHHTVHNPACVY